MPHASCLVPIPDYNLHWITEVTVAKCALAVLFLMLLSSVGLAQSVETGQEAFVAAPGEFGRAYGGEIGLITKQGNHFSGSLGFTTSIGRPTFSGGNALGFGGTLGGAVVADKVWFFASVQQSASPFATGFSQGGRSQKSTAKVIDAKLNAQLGGRQSLAASFAAARNSGISNTTFPGPTPSSFLSLRYSGIVSSNMFFTASMSRQSTARPLIGLVPTQVRTRRMSSHEENAVERNL